MPTDVHSRVVEAVKRSLSLEEDANSKVKLSVRILNDLWEHRGKPEALKPDSVAARVYAKEIMKSRNERKHLKPEEIFRPFRDSIRVAVSDLRDDLRLFSDTDAGRRLPFVVGVAERTYELTFLPSDLWLKSFWMPLLQDGPTRIIYSTPLFIRHPERRLFARLQDVNREWKLRRYVARRRRAGQGRLPEAVRENSIVEAILDESSNLKPCRPYTTVGETKAVVTLNERFRSMGIECRSIAANDLHDLVLGSQDVLLGNVRTNPLMLQIPRSSVEIRQRPKSIVVRGTTDDFRDSVRPFGIAYGLISRIERFTNGHGGGSSGARGVYSFAAHYGQVIAKLVEIATDDVQLRRVIEKAACGDAGDLPGRIEILLQFQLKEDESPGDWSMVLTRTS